MNIDLSNRLYKVDNQVYIGYNQVAVHNQRGRLFVKHKGKQINLKNIPVLPSNSNEDDPVFNYVFKGVFQTNPCPAIEYWIERWRLNRKISIAEFKANYRPSNKLIAK